MLKNEDAFYVVDLSREEEANISGGAPPSSSCSTFKEKNQPLYQYNPETGQYEQVGTYDSRFKSCFKTKLD
ncbi:hypothetical protein LC608_34020 [Nostoc sp. XA010]|uniref:hypothetical protein n=1 Tax=Nostoc sp. XA010 TaxID=2780407 RepID=UPI001E317722|nr:hypothetical protein [Nostoc sp. XA010]MCC5661873.1 hypothetical protein [Nostoc sp. XA010]